MRKLFLIAYFFGFCGITAPYAQTVIIDERFDDGNFTSNPTWIDSDAKYIINVSNRLQLDAASATGEAGISTSSNAAYGEWEALIRLGFNPSGSNRAKFYLLSDTQSIKAEVSGYYVMIGDTEEEISLYRQDGNSNTKIIDGTDGLIDHEPIVVRIKATRDTDGSWELFADSSGGTNYTSQGTVTDNTYTQSNFVGFLSDYTSTRSDAFAYDDILVTKVNPPLEIRDISLPDDAIIDIHFNIEVDPASVSASDFSVNHGIGSPGSTSLPSADVIRLSYPSPLPSGQYTLTVSNVNDADGKPIAPNSTAAFSVFGKFSVGDVIINEFAYDPAEDQSEFVELKNTSDKLLNLQNWQIAEGAGIASISGSELTLQPNEFLVISADTTALYNIYGPRPYVETNIGSLNNDTDFITVITNDGVQADSLHYTSAWGGDDVSLERRSDSAPSIYMENFGNSPNPTGSTAGIGNEVADDTTAPKLVDLSITDNRTLDLQFSERLEHDSATKTKNYTLNNGITISSARQTASDSMRLSLASPLQNGTEYQLKISNQRDIFGNVAATINSSFSYYEVTPADTGDVFINEFMFDPPAGETEYVELYNPTAKSLNIQNWTINDNTGNRRTITRSRFILPPNSFVVISSDETLLKRFPDITLATMASEFPSLNNSGDDIVLRDATGQLLDSLRYTSAWGGDQIALARRSTQVEAIRANFGDAPNGFGTPGSANKIPGDNEPPILNELHILDQTTLELIFSEAIDAASATNKANYNIRPHRGIQLIAAMQDTINLYLARELQSEQPYKISIQNLQDLFKNTIAKTTRELRYIAFNEAQPGDIIINEFLYRRGGAGNPEFVELFNPTDQNYDLSNWKLGDARGTATIPAGTQLHSGHYLVLTGDASLAVKLENGVHLSSIPSFNNDEDAIYIQNISGVTIDSLFYNAQFGGNIDGKSAERKDPQAATNDPANFATSTADDGVTPGTKNSAFMPDEVSPTIQFAHIVSNGNIELRFSEFITLTPELGFSLGGQALTVDSFDPANADIIYLSAPPGIKPGSELVITAKNISDVKGNITASTQLAVAQPLRPGDVVINEILYNPLRDTEDNRPDQSEYLELRNIRDYAISLEGISLHDAPDEEGEIRTIRPVSTRTKYIAAQSTALIYADKIAAFSQSRAAEFFGISNQSPHTLIRVERSSLSLASTDDAIFLTGSNGTPIDSVFYNESWQNPNLIDTDGIALERISPFVHSNDESNWGSSTDERGGTPNSENSIFQSSQNKRQDEIGISFDPNPFSPDDDGTDDRLFINYRLDQPDYLISVNIYDRYGRHVRELADGKPAGFEGKLIWDGLKDNGHRNRIGIYIVIFEAFDSSGGKNRTFKKTVVLARKLN